MRKPKLAPAPDLKLNLGCGRTKLEGYVNVDLRDADVVFDLRQTPWPWVSGAVAEITCIYAFNYFDVPERIAFMNESFRILKPEGLLQIRVPHWSSMRSTSDPGFKWPAINEMSFMSYNREWRQANEQECYGINCDFDYTYGYALDSALNARSDEYKQMAVKHYNNAVFDLIVTLKKRGP